MKPLVALAFAVSLVLNAALAILFVRRGSEPAPRALVGAPAPAPRSSPINADIWSNLRTDDLRALVTGLREDGFPSEMIRAILSHQIAEQFAARRTAVETASHERPFWQNPIADRKTRAALQQLEREQARLFREILGDDAFEDHPLRDLDRGWRFGGLPPGKADQLRRILQDIDQRSQEVFAAGAMLQPEREKMAALEREQREALARILTPAELLDYQLHSSPTASNLRSSLVAFNPTEDEFRALFRLRQPFDEQWNQRWPSNPSTPDLDRARALAEQQLNEHYKAALGPERWADYERATDDHYRRTTQLVARLELPPQTSDQLWSARAEFHERVSAIFSDRTLSATERNARLTTLAHEANARVAPLIGGPHRLETYKENGGAWLQNLQPKPAPGMPPPAPPPPR